jgi:hypothetical protein
MSPGYHTITSQSRQLPSTRFLTTHHSSNDQPIIHPTRMFNPKPRPQPRHYDGRGDDTHGNDARRRAPSPGLGINVVGSRPCVMRAIAGGEEGRQRPWSHAGSTFVEKATKKRLTGHYSERSVRESGEVTRRRKVKSVWHYRYGCGVCVRLWVARSW